jgi:hypothetical protein
MGLNLPGKESLTWQIVISGYVKHVWKYPQSIVIGFVGRK